VLVVVQKNYIYFQINLQKLCDQSCSFRLKCATNPLSAAQGFAPDPGGKLTAFPDPLAVFSSQRLMVGGEGKGRRGRKGEQGREGKSRKEGREREVQRGLHPPPCRIDALMQSQVVVKTTVHKKNKLS